VEELGDGDEAMLDKIEEYVNTNESIRVWCRCDVFVQFAEVQHLSLVHLGSEKRWKEEEISADGCLVQK